jgi:hypothetical protein
VVSHKDIERGGWGLFPEPQSRVLDTDVLPADVLEGLATVQLQLPAHESAWAHHLAEAERCSPPP